MTTDSDDTCGSGRSTHQLQYLRFAQYNSWFNGQLYACVATLDDAERKRDRGAFFGSIHATLNHILVADRSWLGRIEASPLPFRSLVDADLEPDLRDLAKIVTEDFDELRRARRATDTVLEAFVRELTPELLAEDLAYTNVAGIAFSHPLWHVVSHLFNHGTHHRGQVTTLLSQAGVDPGMTDFLVTAMMPLDGGRMQSAPGLL